MRERRFDVGVVVARRPASGVWGRVTWRPAVALAAAPPLEAGSFLSHSEGEDLYYCGAFTLCVHASETAHYQDNLRFEPPRLWIAVSCEGDFPAVQLVSADPYEGEALAEIYGEGLDAVPMPGVIRDELGRFVEEHHVERTFVKRKRT